MKKSLIFAALAALTISLGLAVDVKDYETRMKSAGKNMGGANKALQASDLSAVATHAAAITEALEGTEGFWKERGSSQAVQWTSEGVAASRELAAAAKSGNADQVKTAMGKLGGSCKACHAAHREKLPDGTYKIK